MKIKIPILFILILTFSNCKSPKFYNELSKFESETGLNFKSYKLVLKELDRKYQTSDHIIFQYSLIPEWNSNEFSGVIYDVDLNEYYYFENTKKKPRRIIIKEEYPFPEDNYYEFVIENYMNRKVDYLQKLGESSNLSGITSTNVIYDINLNTGNIDRFTYKDFLFMEGEPKVDTLNK
ncbi:hypothetical protein ML462_15560 [Gramella lutea]|uniref:Uncharacterized protein n=1 Tax=Christiangramia lutea TaxID=1607951 RepID=A0A9X2AAK0_9FLAO|nr:hypothetical protein [Christiangramia lutea]MCH4824590.1 hypothetical protein [Christiangramia lutea]